MNFKLIFSIKRRVIYIIKEFILFSGAFFQAPHSIKGYKIDVKKALPKVNPTLKSGLGSRCRSRVFLAPWSQSRSRLEKKSRAGAANKLAGSSALMEDEKHKEIVHLLLFFR